MNLILLTVALSLGDNSDLPVAFETGTIATEQVKKIEKPPAKTKVKAEVWKFSGYPVRPSNTWWTGCKDWTHLAQGAHAGQFPVEWLKMLSNAEIQSLHSDDHEGKVKTQYIPGRDILFTATENKDVSIPTMIVSPPIQSFFPTGTCPPSSYQRSGVIFGRTR